MRGVNVVGLVLALCPILYFSLFIMANCFCFTQIMRYMDEKMMRYKLSLYVFSIAHNRKTFDKVAVQIAALFAILMRGVNVVGLVLTLCPILYFSFLIIANLFFVSHRWITCDDDWDLYYGDLYGAHSRRFQLIFYYYLWYILG